MTKVNVIIDFSKWNKKISEPKNYIKKKVRKIKRNKFLKGNNKEFSLFLTSSKKMKNLNFKFKNKNKSTDVLSFPNNDKFLNTDYLGDVAINFEIVDKRSKDTNFNYEFDRMWVHGYLHLLGFDHKKNKDFAKMSKIEKKMNYGFYQPCAAVNYPGKEVPYTRIIEYKHFLNQESPHTVIVSETTNDHGEPYYPVPNKKNMDLYQRYQKLAEHEQTHSGIYFVGRLANYKYFNMDQAIKNAINFFETKFL